MKKQIIFIIISILLPASAIYSASLNITGDTIVNPFEYKTYYAINVGENETVIWKITHGASATGLESVSMGNDDETGEWVLTGPKIDFVQWDDIPAKGRISYTVRDNPAKYGYADVEILSVYNSQVDNIRIGNFPVCYDTVYIPKGQSGSVDCSASMIFPAAKDGSKTPVTIFNWSFPVSMGGKSYLTSNEVTARYDAYGGNGQEISVEPIGLCNDAYFYGKPRTYTIKRFDGTIETNRNIYANENFEGENLLFSNINIFGGVYVPIHATNSVRLLPQFHACFGSNVHIMVGTNLLRADNANPATKVTAGAGNPIEEPTAGVSQNYPNPCCYNTSIDYYLRQNTGEAFLYIVSYLGEVVRSIPMDKRGYGTLNPNISGLSPGIYLYYMVADGQMQPGKHMVIRQ